MRTPMQEAVAQVMFWSGLGCLPLAILVFAGAFLLRSRWKRWGLFALGSVLLTQFLWYFLYLGGALATKVGEFHPTPWWQLYPAGFGVAAVLAAIRVLGGRRVPEPPGPPPIPPPTPDREKADGAHGT